MAVAAATVPTTDVVSRTHMPYRTDDGIGTRARIGLIVLASDQTTEYEFRDMLALDSVAFYEARLYNAPEITRETLLAMEKDIAPAAGLIMPGLRIDVMAFGCTSGSMVIGEERVAELIRQARPGVACTTPITGAIAGMQALGIGRVALLTPYVQEINDMMRAYLEARGIAVPVMGSFNQGDDHLVARITPDSVADAARELARAGKVDGVFVSCTSLRVARIVEQVEAETGLPLLSSNHAMAWHCLRLAGYRDPVPGFGRLFRL